MAVPNVCSIFPERPTPGKHKLNKAQSSMLNEPYFAKIKHNFMSFTQLYADNQCTI